MPHVVEFVASSTEFSERKAASALPARGRDRKGALYALVDVEGSVGGTLVEQIRQSLSATFYQDAGSVTSSLLRAIRRVNESLFEENERSIRSERRYATIVAAVVRDTDLYFAIVGPGRAYLIDDGPTERIGADDDEPTLRVGEADDVGIAMYHRGRERASILVLTSGGLPTMLDKAMVEVPEIPAERTLPLLRLLGEHGGMPFRAVAIVPNELAAHLGPGAEVLPDPNDEYLTPEPQRAPSFPREHSDRLRRDDDFEEENAPRFRPRFQFQVPRGVYIGIGIFVLFVVGYFVAQIPLGLLRNGAAYANTMTRLAQAEQEEQVGLKQADALMKRQHLDNARRLALEAQALGPDNPTVATAVARIENEYQAATGTIALPAPIQLLNLPSPADEMVVQSLEIYLLHRQASQVDRYLMNADQTAVLSTASPTLIRKGDHVGGSTVGDLVTMAWIPAGGARDADSLVVLDRSGFLVQYDSTRGLRTLTLRDPTTWDHVSELGGYAGNLFALNPANQTLTWYPPEPGGYDGDAYNYFAPTTRVSLGDTADFMAGNDLYLVHLSGQIEKFTAGTAASFTGPPTDLAPAHPVGFAIASGSVYVGDPQRALILQIGTDGAYQRALGGSQSESTLASMRDLAVSDDGKSLYVLTDHAIERFDLTQEH